MSALARTEAALQPRILNHEATPEPAFNAGTQLASALAAARDKCQAAEKDAYNDHHRYKYASAESIIAAAKEAMRGSGLSLIPLSHTLRATGDRPGAEHLLSRKLLLVHTSGESVPLSADWPVMPERGRPLDKALAIALTASYAYLLRDLLQMPRVEPEEDLAAQGDTAPAATAKPANGKPAEPLSPKLAELKRLKEALAIDAGQWAAILAKRGEGVTSARQLTEQQQDELIGKLKAKFEKESKTLQEGMAESAGLKSPDAPAPY